MIITSYASCLLNILGYFHTKRSEINTSSLGKRMLNDALVHCYNRKTQKRRCMQIYFPFLVIAASLLTKYIA